MTAAGAPVPSSMKGTTLRLMVPAAVPSTAWSVSRPAPGKVSHALERRVRHLVHVDAVEVVDEVAGDDPQEDSLDRLERVGRPVEVVRLKCQTDAAVPKHMAKWNERVTPAAPATKVPECDGCRTGHCR